MHKFMEILVCIFALIGLACVVKHLMRCEEEGCCLCGWHKTKEDGQSAGKTASYKIKVD